jgi:hypothetical protein
VVGRVLDAESGDPIGTVEVRLVGEGESLVRLSDGEGAFLFPRVQPGTYEVVLMHLAYGTQADTIEVRRGELLSYEARLVMEPIELAPLAVTVQRRAVSPMLLGFYERMSMDMGGHFITREDIKRRQPHRISQMIGEAPGTRVRCPGGGCYVVFARYERDPRGACRPAVYVDRMYMGGGRNAPPAGVDEFVIPTEVEAVEVYDGPGSLPAAFGGSGSGCGAIVIWTRRGMAASEAAERQAYLGVVTGSVDIGDASFGTARYFRGIYTNGQFTIDEGVAPGAFPFRQPLPCLSSQGEAMTVTVDSLAPYNPPAWDEPDLTVTVRPAQSSDQNAGILFWTGEPQIERAEGREVALDPAARELMESETRWLWREAVDQLPEGERELEMRIERDDVRAFGSDLITVHRYPVIGSSDRRGWFFLVYSPLAGQVLYGTFGHPEWHPDATLTAIRPHLFFRIEDDPRLYALAARVAAWKRSDWIILDVRTGAPVLEAY